MPTEARDLRAEVLDWLTAREKECEGATKGPWRWDGSDSNEQPEIESADGQLVALVTHECVKPAPENDANANLIASARTALPLALKALRQEVEEHVPELSSEGRERCSECDWDWQENSCPALRRLHAALLGGESNV